MACQTTSTSRPPLRTRVTQERLATICEAHFASRLEQQLGAWGGLSEGQRDMLLDALLDWARYSDKLERCALREFCLHAAARHLARAQERCAALEGGRVTDERGQTGQQSRALVAMQLPLLAVTASNAHLLSPSSW